MSVPDLPPWYPWHINHHITDTVSSSNSTNTLFYREPPQCHRVRRSISPLRTPLLRHLLLYYPVRRQKSPAPWRRITLCWWIISIGAARILCSDEHSCCRQWWMKGRLMIGRDLSTVFSSGERPAGEVDDRVV